MPSPVRSILRFQVVDAVVEGWVLGYAYDATSTTLNLMIVLRPAPLVIACPVFV